MKNHYKYLKKEGKKQLVEPFLKDKKHKIVISIFLSFSFLWFLLLISKSFFPQLISDSFLLIYLFLIIYLSFLYSSFKLYDQASKTINLKLKIDNYVNAWVIFHVSLMPLIMILWLSLKIYNLILPKSLFLVVICFSLLIAIPGAFVLWYILKKYFRKSKL